MQCVCFYPIKIGIKKRSYEQNEEKKKLIQHNVTYKKLKKKKFKRAKENVVDNYKEL